MLAENRKGSCGIILRENREKKRIEKRREKSREKRREKGQGMMRGRCDELREVPNITSKYYGTDSHGLLF